MQVTLTIITVISWLLLLFMVFQYERIDKRLSTLTVLTEQLLQTQKSLVAHAGIAVSESEEVKKLRRMVAEGKVFEAQAAYRAWSGASHKESLLYIDTLRAANSDTSTPTTNK